MSTHWKHRIQGKTVSIVFVKFVTNYSLGGKILSFRNRKFWPFFWCVLFSVLIRAGSFFLEVRGWGPQPPSGRNIWGTPLYMGLRVLDTLRQLDPHSESWQLRQVVVRSQFPFN